jgi:hypothetical protein
LRGERADQAAGALLLEGSLEEQARYAVSHN